MITTSRMAKKSECIATLASRTAARRTNPAKKMAMTEAMASLMLVEARIPFTSFSPAGEKVPQADEGASSHVAPAPHPPFDSLRSLRAPSPRMRGEGYQSNAIDRIDSVAY